jgi:hypothetical protein
MLLSSTSTIEFKKTESESFNESLEYLLIECNSAKDRNRLHAFFKLGEIFNIEKE